MSSSPATQPAHDAPATLTVKSRRFACDGGEGQLGHPRVWLTIPHETGWIDCPYCDTRYTLDPAAEDSH